MNDVTIVSALFNIHREGMDGRKWEEYLRWFDIFLKLKCPMILFVSKDVQDFIEERRLAVPTTVITQEIEEILPEAVRTGGYGQKQVNYEKIIPLLIECIKELKAKIGE